MKKTVSFYLENEFAKTSALWIIDIKDTADIYIKNNITKDDLHFSQHQSNEAHETFSKEFMINHDIDYEDRKLIEIDVKNYNDFTSPCLIWSYRTAGEELNAPTYTSHSGSHKISLKNGQVAEIFVLRVPRKKISEMPQLSFGKVIKHNSQDEYTCIRCTEHINDTYILALYRLLDYTDIFKKNFTDYKIKPVEKAKSEGAVLAGDRMLLVGEIKNRYIWGNDMKSQFGHVELYV